MPYIRVPLTDILSIGKIVTLYSLGFGKNYRTEGESHDFWELVYVNSGEVGLFGGEVMHKVSAGEMILHKPNEFHRVEADGVHESSVFIITFECKSPAMKFFYDKTFALSPRLRAMMQQLIEECAKTFVIQSYPLKLREDMPVGGMQLMRNLLETLLIYTMRQESGDGRQFYRTKESLESDLVRDINRYFEDHLCERVTLDEISRHFHFGVSSLCAIYKKATGETMMHHFLMMKIEEAKTALRSGDETIASISERLAFDTPQYFTRMFCAYVGQTPTAFRNSIASRDIVFCDGGPKNRTFRKPTETEKEKSKK